MLPLDIFFSSLYLAYIFIYMLYCVLLYRKTVAIASGFLFLHLYFRFALPWIAGLMMCLFFFDPKFNNKIIINSAIIKDNTSKQYQVLNII